MLSIQFFATPLTTIRLWRRWNGPSRERVLTLLQSVDALVSSTFSLSKLANTLGSAVAGAVP